MDDTKIIVIAGPTATGKTAYAIQLAQKIGGEVISADSRQIYRGINLLSGKVTKKEMAGVPHHMLDVASPKRTYSVAQFQKAAQKIIKDIHARGKTPIICGGTGLYIDAITKNSVFPEVPPNPKLRKELQSKSAPALFALLNKLDPARATTIDKHNPVRLVRAIEIARALGAVPLAKNTPAPYCIEWIYIDRDDAVLKKRIHMRLLARLRQGMLKEASNLHKKGLSWKRMEELGLECRSTAQYLQGKLSKEKMIEEIESESWNYVKRQRTWFKKDKSIKWIKPAL
jgi:tRNA dimethylallyltransferase